MTDGTLDTAPPPLQVLARIQDHQQEWFAATREHVAAGGHLAMAGSLVPHEIFEAFDIPCLASTTFTGMIAQSGQVQRYYDVLSARGYHPGLFPGLIAPAVGMALEPDGGEPKPWGGLPKPSLVLTSPDDGTELIAEAYGIPYIAIHRPVDRHPYPAFYDMGKWAWEDLEQTPRLDTMVAQLGQVVSVCEELTGRRLDLDRLREIIEMSNRQQEIHADIRRMMVEAPKLPVSLADVESSYGGLQFHRGTQWALDETQAFRDEVAARVEQQQWICPGERIRLSMNGIGLGRPADFYRWFEESHGAVFVRSDFLNMIADNCPRYGLRDPIRNLAARYATFNQRLYLPPWGVTWHTWEVELLRSNGAVFTRERQGTKFMINDLEQRGIPVLQTTPTLRKDGWEALRPLIAEFIETRIKPRE